MKLLFYVFVIASIVVVAGIFLYRPHASLQITPDQKKTLAALSFQSYLKANYNFSTDSDSDGLSDAKEIIYGSDPNKADTDGDGFSDGQEVIAGFDPLVPGKVRLTDRKQLSLSIQYFSWLQTKSGDPNPPLEAKHISEFLTEQHLLEFSLKPVLEYDIHFTNDDPNKIADYLKFTSSLTLPEEGSPYLAFAGQLVKQKSLNDLTKILDVVQAQLNQLKKAQVPPLMIELHRHYVGIWQELNAIFSDLKHAQDDPVLVYRDQKEGEWLVEQVKNTEILRANLIAQLKLLPFQQHGTQATNTANK